MDWRSNDRVIRFTASPFGYKTSTEDPWEQKELYELLETHRRFWTDHRFTRESRLNDLATLNAQLREYETISCVIHGGKGDRKNLIGGGGPAPAHVMLLLKAPGWMENRTADPLSMGTCGHDISRVIGPSTHVAFVLPVYPSGEWERNIPSNVVDQFSIYLRIRMRLVEPRLVVCVGAFPCQFLMAGLNAPNISEIKMPGVNVVQDLSLSGTHRMDLKFVRIVHPFQTNEKCGLARDQLIKNQISLRESYTLIQEAAGMNREKRNAFQVMENAVTKKARLEKENKKQESAPISTDQTSAVAIPLLPSPLPPLPNIGQWLISKRLLLCHRVLTGKADVQDLVKTIGLGLIVNTCTTRYPNPWFDGTSCEQLHIPVRQNALGPTDSQMDIMEHNVKETWHQGAAVGISSRQGDDRNSVAAACLLLKITPGSLVSQAIERVRNAKAGALSHKDKIRFITNYAQRINGEGNGIESLLAAADEGSVPTDAPIDTRDQTVSFYVWVEHHGSHRRLDKSFADMETAQQFVRESQVKADAWFERETIHALDSELSKFPTEYRLYAAPLMKSIFETINNDSGPYLFFCDPEQVQQWRAKNPTCTLVERKRLREELIDVFSEEQWAEMWL